MKNSDKRVRIIVRGENPVTRFWGYVEQRESGCWEWTGAKRSGFGYGGVPLGKNRREYAHRFAWQIAAAQPIPQGLSVLHRCDNPLCVNPSHLFLGTIFDNNHDRHLKGRSRGGLSGMTHCLRGHELTPENTRVRPKDGSRSCRICMNRRQREYDRRAAIRQRALRKVYPAEPIYISATEFARRTGLAKETVLKRLHEGKIRAIRPQSWWKIPRIELIKFQNAT